MSNLSLINEKIAQLETFHVDLDDKLIGKLLNLSLFTYHY